MNKKWEVLKYDEEQAKIIAKENNISEILANVILNRGIKKEDVDVFLSPTRNDFHDPYLMPDMEKAVNRIIDGINGKERIYIYGDYDVDGITSTTVLKKFLEERDIKVNEYIPNRLSEGYGLNKNAIDKIKNNGCDLLITVDCGISGIEEIEYAKSLGIDVIVTDHHEPGDEIPNCIAVVDAKRKDNKYPFNQLAGVGVVFKLIQAISIRLNLKPEEYLKYLDIVCVGTISDIVPLVDENRVIAKLGLKLVEVTRNIGLKILVNSLGGRKIDSACVSFGVAPRINACGRMGFQNEALELFLTKNINEAREITKRLNEYNNQRQQTEKRIFEEAINEIENEKQNEKEDLPCIILGKENWHHGVIGIVSSKLTDMYFKPSILICFEEEEGKGSGRSIPGFDLHEALMNCSTYVERFGGHSMAIGINVKKENFSKFKQEIEEYATKSNICDIIPVINVDKEVSLKEIDIQLVKEIELLEPFGEANKMPVFLIKNLKIQSIRTLSDGKHIKLRLSQDNYIIDAIGFNLGHLAENYQIGDKIDVVGNLEINSYRREEQVQMTIKDFRKTTN